MMCTTVLHEGVCHRTSTPHKSGNKEKKKRLQIPGSGPDKCNIIKEDKGIWRKHK